ncbi:MAG: EthD family reductase [Ignavibacteria bacterium]
MVKMIALYKTPDDVEEFEKHYFDIHMPLIAKIPGLLKTEVAKLSGLPGQESKFYMMAEMYFDDIDKLNAGMASPEGKASARDLMSFAKNYVVLMNGEISP